MQTPATNKQIARWAEHADTPPIRYADRQVLALIARIRQEQERADRLWDESNDLALARLQAEVNRLREALMHETYRPHEHNGVNCSACETSERLLEVVEPIMGSAEFKPRTDDEPVPCTLCGRDSFDTCAKCDNPVCEECATPAYLEGNYEEPICRQC